MCPVLYCHLKRTACRLAGSLDVAISSARKVACYQTGFVHSPPARQERSPLPLLKMHPHCLSCRCPAANRQEGVTRRWFALALALPFVLVVLPPPSLVRPTPQQHELALLSASARPHQSMFVVVAVFVRMVVIAAVAVIFAAMRARGLSAPSTCH